jgi:hypothetical protein
MEALPLFQQRKLEFRAAFGNRRVFPIAAADSKNRFGKSPAQSWLIEARVLEHGARVSRRFDQLILLGTVSDRRQPCRRTKWRRLIGFFAENSNNFPTA